MSKTLHIRYATDSEIFDLLMSGRQRLTESVLHELAQDRGIFYSIKETRDDLVNKLSLLCHDYNDIQSIIHKREHSRRGEKTTSITFSADLTIDQIKHAVNAYASDVNETETINSHKKGNDEFVMQVNYDDYDYSKTRLIQRHPQDATILFKKLDGRVLVQLPATEKSKDIVQAIQEKIALKNERPIETFSISLSDLNKAEDRTAFFTSLISEMDEFTPETVSNLRIASSTIPQNGEDVDDLDQDEIEDAQKEMLGVVHSVALNGDNLMTSPVYQQLKQRGFFITSITWKTKLKKDPYTKYQIYVGFENGQEGTGFRYAIRAAWAFKSGSYRKSPRHVEDKEKAHLFGVIEDTAQSVLQKLLAQLNDKIPKLLASQDASTSVEMK
jgi:hypothetical protein